MNLHDELGRHGADATAGSARSLGSVEVRDTLSARVRRGRRRRAAGGAGAVAAVALVAVGVWSVLPGMPTDAQPAEQGSGPYLYGLGSGDELPVVEPQLTLLGEDAVACGDPLALTPGVTVHHEEAFAAEPRLEATLTTASTLNEAAGVESPSFAGWDPDEPVWGAEFSAEGLNWHVVPILIEDGAVTGIGQGIGSTATPGGGRAGAGGAAPIPHVGECAERAITGTEPSGDPLDTVLVAQMWGYTSTDVVEGRTLLATIVVDPTVPLTRVEPPQPETEYNVDASASVVPDVPIDLRRPAELECEAPVDLTDGVQVHDDAAITHGVTVGGKAWYGVSAAVMAQHPGEITRDVWDRMYGEPGTGFPVTLDASRYEAFFAHSIRWEDGAGMTTITVPLLLQDGKIAGIGLGQGAAGSGAGGLDGVEWVTSPLPGECGELLRSQAYGDGDYEPVLVTQVWSESLQEPLATIVYSAGEIEYTGLGDPEPSPDQGAGELTIDGPESGIEVIETRDWFDGVGCPALLDGEDYVTGAVEDRGYVSSLPLPTTLETGRLYGYGDDALVGGYPIRVSGVDFDDEYLSGFADLGDARLVVHGDGQTWIFTAAWSERDDLPHDEPGWFVELNQVWDCGSPDLIPEGEYDASLVVPRFEDVYDLAPITVVSGVPSIPELDGQG